MPEASTYLIEIAAHDAALAGKMLYASSGGYRTGPNDTPPNTEYPARISDPGTLDRSLFSPGRTMGDSESAFGAITLVNQSGALDGWLDFGVDGHQVTLKRLASPRAAYITAETVMRATATRFNSSRIWSELALGLYDRRLLLDKPVQSNRYGGTTINGASVNKADGTADQKDRPKPLVYGTALNVPAVCVNPFNLIYQVNDGPVAGLAVYDAGVPLTAAADHANLAALAAAVVPAGKYATCRTLGLFKLGATPYKAVTADVTEGATIDLRSAASVALRIFGKMGITGPDVVSAASFTALGALAPQEVGIFINGEDTGLTVISRVLGSIGGYVVPGPLGVFSAGRLAFTVPSWDLDQGRIHAPDGDIALVVNPDTEGGVPAWRTVIRHRKAWQVQDDSALARACVAARRGLVGSAYREAAVQTSAVRTMYQNAPELAVDTLMLNPADAAAEAARRHALYSVRRDVLTVPVRRDDAVPMQLGTTGTVMLPRLGYQGGRTMIVIGRREMFAREMVDLTLWG